MASTPLARKLVRQIEATGPISVAEFMAACLGDPDHGYYTTREPFGQGGDFITSPEISQVFGELIGLSAVATWEAMGSPDAFVFAELGPGRGTLIADALRAARIRPAFLAAATVALVEISPRLGVAQAEAIAPLGIEPLWRDRVDDLPAGPLIVIANEFFDALPVRQIVRTSDGWAERMIGLGEKGELVFGLRPTETGAAEDAPNDLPPGTVFELRPAATAIASELGHRIAADGGAALVIDYGYAEPGFGDTLQALYRQLYDSALSHPGEADLTAHVDFPALARAATAAGAVAYPVTTQGEFLGLLGISDRVRALAAGKAPEEQQAIGVAAHRLVHPDAMGLLFKVLAIGAPGLALPRICGLIVPYADRCAGCGLAVEGGAEGCQALFETVVGRDFSDRRYGRVHGLVVDCYCLQHPARYCISGKSFAAHLCGLCERLEDDAGYGEHDERLRRWLDGARKPDKPAELPAFRGALTIADVLAAESPEAHVLVAERWARAIWAEYAPFHALARNWLAEAHAFVPAPKRRR